MSYLLINTGQFQFSTTQVIKIRPEMALFGPLGVKQQIIKVIKTKWSNDIYKRLQSQGHIIIKKGPAYC